MLFAVVINVKGFMIDDSENCPSFVHFLNSLTLILSKCRVLAGLLSFRVPRKNLNEKYENIFFLFLVSYLPLLRQFHASSSVCYPAHDVKFEEAKTRLNSLQEDPGNEAKLKIYALFKQV